MVSSIGPQNHQFKFPFYSIYPLNDPLVFGAAKENGLDDNSSDEDSEDSNAESNWKNDYPDEDDMDSINEEDMVSRNFNYLTVGDLRIYNFSLFSSEPLRLLFIFLSKQTSLFLTILLRLFHKVLQYYSIFLKL